MFTPKPTDEQKARSFAALAAIINACIHGRKAKLDPAISLLGCDDLSDIQHLARALGTGDLVSTCLAQLASMDPVAWTALQGWLLLPGHRTELHRRVGAVRQRLIDATEAQIQQARVIVQNTLSQQGVAA